MNPYTDQEDDVQFSEPILAQKGVRLKVMFVEKNPWKNKVDDQNYDAIKLTFQIDNPSSVRTEHADAKPRLTIEDQFNIESFLYEDKKTGEVKKLGRTKLYQLEETFGFDPIFTVGGNVVEPFVTKRGNKVAPKVEGVKRIVNPSFFKAYFNMDGSPIVDSFVDKTIYADIEVESSEQFGDRNVIARYVKAPIA